MNSVRGKFKRFYGNRNKIVRVRNDSMDAVVYLLAERLHCTYQEAFEMVINYQTAKEAFGLDMVSRIERVYRG